MDDKRDENSKPILEKKPDQAPIKKDGNKTLPAERNPVVPETKEEVNPQGNERKLDTHTGEGTDFKRSNGIDRVKPY